MKKLVLTVAIVLGLSFGVSAQIYNDNSHGPQGGGMFQKGRTRDGESTSTPAFPLLGGGLNSDANNPSDTPLADGVLILAGLGAAYLIGKKRKD